MTRAHVHRADVALGISLLVTGLSAISLALQLLIRCRRRNSMTAKAVPPRFRDLPHEHVTDSNAVLTWACFVSQRRGDTVFVLNCSRFLCCLALFVLSLWTAGLHTNPPRQPEHDSVQAVPATQLTSDLVRLAPCLIYVGLLASVALVCTDDCTRRTLRSSLQQLPSRCLRQSSGLCTSTPSLSQLGLHTCTGMFCHWQRIPLHLRTRLRVLSYG